MAFDGEDLAPQERHLTAVVEQAEGEAEQAGPAERAESNLAQHAAVPAPAARAVHMHMVSAADSVSPQKRRRWPTSATLHALESESEPEVWGVTAPTPLTTHRDRCSRG